MDQATAPEVIPAATVVIFRNCPRGGPPELLMVQRSKGMRFAGGATVFPGGRIDPEDRKLAAQLLPDMVPEEAAARVAAMRETLEEISIEGKTIFLTAGGKDYHSIPCLNERDDWIHALADITAANLGGWVGGEPAAEQLARARERAIALGAKS